MAPILYPKIFPSKGHMGPIENLPQNLPPQKDPMPGTVHRKLTIVSYVKYIIYAGGGGMMR